MGSTRLPGKVLMDLGGEPILAHCVERARAIPGLNGVMVATTRKAEDDAIASLCGQRGWNCFRGEAEDVLDRYWRAASICAADAIMRITADCPLLDPQVAAALLNEFMARQRHETRPCEYASNFYPLRTFPRGLDVEIIGMPALRRIWLLDRNPAWREHVTEYVLHHSSAFSIFNLTHSEDLSAVRWTVDTPEDLELIRLIHAQLEPREWSWRAVMKIYRRHPEWLNLNAHVRQKGVA
jgi:spore coat polysaccharide biosynthesis protein SpsF